MNAIKPANPFIIGRYESAEYFCDREEETATLIKHIVNGRHVSLISPRRLGKTVLIEHLFSKPEVKNHYYTFFIDIYSTSSLAEFVSMLGKEIFSRLKPVKTKWSEKFLQVVGSLRPGVKYDSLTGDISFDIGIGDIQSPQISLDEIFSYLEMADKHCVVAIDEFQQIAQYHEKNVDAILRTKIQHCRNVTFIFTGSKRHMMSLMFYSPSKPFYQSTIGMGLQPIAEDVYCRFATALFSSRKKSIDHDVLTSVYRRYCGYTWYVQMMMNELFAITDKGETCSVDMIHIAHRNVITSQSDHYAELLCNLGTKQKILLKALAKEWAEKHDWISGLTSSSFVRKHSLQSSSSVQAALKGLIDKEIVTQQDGKYRIYDFFLAEWYAEQ